jgi:EAL domain-containing protein (putative c-di-GMP-specific phosphodiesterase class I)/ActR/RegA family two-component response regulator
MQGEETPTAKQTACLGAAPRLLVIDDDLVQRSIIPVVGKRAGYECDSASSVEEADRLLQAHNYDCVTLDLSLGEHSGTQLLRAIAAAGKTRVIIISGSGERILNSAVRLANMLGIASCQIPKPLDLAELRRTLLATWPGGPRADKAPPAQAIEVSDLTAALERGEIVPWFQPKIELATSKVVGCEALARWRHATAGWVAPDLFVPLAESCGLMPQLTDALLRAATKLVRPIVERYPDFSVAVNVSSSMLADLSLADQIDRALADSGLPTRALTVEITESAAMSNIAKAADVLVGLRVKGVGLAIDDFGTGYSSLAALARMPFSELKIDRVFVRDSETDRDMARVVCASVRLGHELGMKVVAEGIETTACRNRVSEMGCDIGQGMIFAAALEASALHDWIDQWCKSNEHPSQRWAASG